MKIAEWAVARKALMRVAIRSGKTLEEVRKDISDMITTRINRKFMSRIL